MPLNSGDTFAGFRIIRLLGSGGMGEVYLVQHPRLPRRNALKVLPADVSADPEYRARFNREADLASTLYHPHIVGVHDRGEYDGQLWISMDFVDGFDAARLLASRFPAGMPTEQVVRIVTAVAGALDYANKQGLLHRDVKPANIMLTHLDDDGEQRILLADFGIARNVDDVSGLTTTNMTVGTVAYSAPEQLMGEEIDGRADQYALAATAYHLLTGSQLFPQSNQAVVISRHLNAAPPTLADTRPELASLDPVLVAALAKDPNNRFARCTDFARALAEATQTTTRPTPSAPTTPAPVSSPRPRSVKPPAVKPPGRQWRAPAIVGAAMALVAVIGTSVAINQPWDTATPPAARTPATSAWPTTTIASTPSAPTSTVAPPPVTTTTTTSVEPAQPYALPGCYRGSDDVALTERPTASPIACRHHFFEGLTWMSWGRRRRRGHWDRTETELQSQLRAGGDLPKPSTRPVHGFHLPTPGQRVPHHISLLQPTDRGLPRPDRDSGRSVLRHGHPIQRHARSPLQRPGDALH